MARGWSIIDKTETKGGGVVQHVEKACAKINLSLDVTGRRADGYHELVSVMQTVSLCDVLTFSRVENGFSMQMDGALPCDGRNLVWRAADAYFAAAGTRFGVHVSLEKQIPVQAGLGGGSADAAATLRALNAMDGDRFDLDTLCEIGATLGADVPFCVRGGTSVCRGIGERITPVTRRFDAYVVVAMRGEGVSTPLAFAALDARYGDFSRVAAEAEARLSRVLGALESGVLASLDGALYNRFEDVILEMRPDVGVLLRALRDRGAVSARMSGSGPAVFGLFEEERAAFAAKDALCAMGADAFVCALQ